MPDNTQWFYAKAGQQLGPVAREQLTQLLVSGQLSDSDLIWAEGMTDWKPAGQFPGLKPAMPMPAPLPVAAAQPYPPAQGYAVRPHNAQYGGQQITYPTGASYNGLAIAGFILALIPSLPTIVGLILCLVALSGMKSSGNREGHGLAKAGVIISIVYLGIAILFCCVMVIAVVMGAR